MASSLIALFANEAWPINPWIVISRFLLSGKRKAIPNLGKNGISDFAVISSQSAILFLNSFIAFWTEETLTRI